MYQKVTCTRGLYKPKGYIYQTVICTKRSYVPKVFRLDSNKDSIDRLQNMSTCGLGFCNNLFCLLTLSKGYFWLSTRFICGWQVPCTSPRASSPYFLSVSLIELSPSRGRATRVFCTRNIKIMRMFVLKGANYGGLNREMPRLFKWYSDYYSNKTVLIIIQLLLT